MNKAARWFKNLFGTKKIKETQSFVSSDCDSPTDHVWSRTFLTEKEHQDHAIAVAIATATAAEAAVSAAEAAAEVVRLTSEGRVGDIFTTEEQLASVKIQKVFRGSLARRALRALKGIVKLQALVRGYLVRKRASAILQSLKALIRIQTAMRSNRINRCLNTESNNMFQTQRSSSRSKSKQAQNVEYEDAWAQNTPRLSASSQHYTPNRCYVMQSSPAKSVCGNVLCDYGSSPGYMERTQSFKAKVRSQSAPHQRFERKRLSLDEIMAFRSSVSGVSLLQQQPQRFSCSYDPC